MKKLIACVFLSMLVFLSSCKKDKTTSTASIEGNYLFQNISAKTQNIITTPRLIQHFTSEYTSFHNGGMISFNNSTFTAINLQYTFNTSEILKEYDNNNIFLDSTSHMFIYGFQAKNYIEHYKTIGADSIYFSQSGFMTNIYEGGYLGEVATKGRYSVMIIHLLLLKTF